ncbi:NPCBM/NEW2 domain-containing protein [Streptomyces sp. NPDC088789]|uniref:NPCBM/NEW2 domain-containing protein n=1 Tax=Streptomyces sp. NPDC088789 TaxID=3365899 RepID=UPI0037F4CF7F
MSPPRSRLLTILSAAALTATAVSATATFGQSPAVAAPQPGVATTPPMGWNTWYTYGCNIDEAKIKAAADAIASGGMKDAGYEYIGVDDCWSAGRDAGGNIKADPAKFPSGMKALGDYIHSKGLKFGLYAAPLRKTCADFEGSLGREQQDANTFASWGVDLLKYDWCDRDNTAPKDLAYVQQRFAVMRDALKATGRPIVYNINPNSFLPATYSIAHDFGDFGHSTRAGEDLTTDWRRGVAVPGSSHLGTLDLIDAASHQVFRGAPDRWVDWDYVQAGINESRPVNEDRAQFTLWAFSGGPLYFADDPTTMKAGTKSILTNADIIAVNQSWGGSAGRRVARTGNADVWAKPLANGDIAVALLNRGDSPLGITTSAAQAGLGGSTSYHLKNLWSGVTSTTTGNISATVPARDVVAFRISRTGSLAAGPLGAGVHQLSSLKPLDAVNGRGPVELNTTNGGPAAGDGTPLTIGGTVYPTGLGTHANANVNYWLGGSCSQFSAKVGIDDDARGKGSAQFGVYGDGRLLAYTDTKTGGQAPTLLNVPTAGVKVLELRALSPVDGVADGTDSDHADWADAKVTCTGTAKGSGSFSSDRTWAAQTNGWGPAERDRSNNDTTATDGLRIKVSGVSYPKGIGAHAHSEITIDQVGCTRFTAVGAVDAEVGDHGSVQFKILGDGGTPLYTSPTVTPNKPAFIDVDTTGHSRIRLVATNAGDNGNSDHADWAGAVHTCP